MTLSNIGFVLLLITAAYGILVLIVFLFQSRLVYFPTLPSRDIIATPKDIGISYIPVDITTADKIKLNAWFLPASKARGVLLFFHGNAGNISHRLDSLKIFHDLGLSVLIFDYRGYGRSQGSPSEPGTYRDAEAAWRYLTEKRAIPANEIIVFGRSLGAAIAAYLANQHLPKALILESSFTSVPDLAAQIYPFLPVRWLAKIRYNTQAHLKSVTCPALIIHSRDDEIIPFAHGRKLFASINAPKQFLELNGGHNDGFLVSGQTYIEGLDRFLTVQLGK